MSGEPAPTPNPSPSPAPAPTTVTADTAIPADVAKALGLPDGAGDIKTVAKMLKDSQTAARNQKLTAPESYDFGGVAGYDGDTGQSVLKTMAQYAKAAGMTQAQFAEFSKAAKAGEEAETKGWRERAAKIAGSEAKLDALQHQIRKATGDEKFSLEGADEGDIAAYAKMVEKLQTARIIPPAPEKLPDPKNPGDGGGEFSMKVGDETFSLDPANDDSRFAFKTAKVKYSGPDGVEKMVPLEQHPDDKIRRQHAKIYNAALQAAKQARHTQMGVKRD